MDVKTKIKMSLKMYDNNEYDTETFCKIFIDMYYFEASGYRFFEGEERVLLDRLAVVAERFTPFETDLIDYPYAYTTEEQVRGVFTEIKNHESVWESISQ